MAYQEIEFQHISRQFQIYGEILHAETFKIGHINETYSASYDQGGTRVRYIHQKINENVFKEPPAVMRNLVRVTNHIRKKLEVEKASRPDSPVAGRHSDPRWESYFHNGDGEYWRTFVFIEGVQTFEAVQSQDQAFEAGRALANFNITSWICLVSGYWRPFRIFTTHASDLKPCRRQWKKTTSTG